MLAAASGAAMWDAAAGVWVGERAANAGLEIPKPLWIFGYGSLCWKQDFPSEEQFVGHVKGWGRFFAQKSMDHRGTPAAPGLVATLLKDEQLQLLGVRPANEELPPSLTVGTCYRVGEQDEAAVLDALDFREKGGYTREIVTIYPQQLAGIPPSPPVRALLYSATPDNPNFDPDALRDVQGAATTIAAAIGPSGPNREYLERLAHWLQEVGERDEHVEAIMRLLPASSTS
jgi:cation transport protein ChaC